MQFSPVGAADGRPAPAFEVHSPWSAWAATLAVIVTVGLAMAAAAAAGTVYFALLHRAMASETLPLGESVPMSDAGAKLGMMAAMALMQVVMVGMMVWMAGWYGAPRRRLLSLTRPLTGRNLALGIAGMLAILVPYNLAIYLAWPRDFFKDLVQFSELAHSSAAWLAAIVVAIGAPLSEELIFRGFLLPALARARPGTVVTIAVILVLTTVMTLVALKLRLGILAIAAIGLIALGIYMMSWRLDKPAAMATDGAGALPSRAGFIAASLFTSAVWTSMHIGYSATGLIEIFLIGLLFCWLVWRTGSVWLTISLHGLYNGLQFLALSLLPLPVSMGG